MDLDDMMAATECASCALNAKEAREIRECFEEATLGYVQLVNGKGETDEANKVYCRIERLSREIAALPPTSIEALRAKISSALYWDDGGSDSWRDIASPHMDTLVQRDVLLSFGSVLASKYKQKLDQMQQQEIMEPRRPRAND